jgi:hypothetical protein
MDVPLTSGNAELLDETPENAAEQSPYDWPTFTFPDRA